MKIGLIINSSAGSITNGKYSTWNLKEMFKSVNINAEVVEMRPGLVDDQVRVFLHQNVDAVVAAGGDGTISAVASAAAENNLPLGVLPLGTLNHFAKDLNIPLVFEDAVKVISTKNIIKVDTGIVNGHRFINNSSIGIYPKMVKHRDKIKKRMGSKWLAMIKAFFVLLIKFPLITVKISSENGKVHCRTPFVFIGNNEYDMSISGIGTRKSISDGKLSLYYPVVTGRLSMFKFFILALFNRLHKDKNFIIESVTDVTIESKKKELEVSIDGEVLHLAPPLYYKICSRNLPVIIP